MKRYSWWYNMAWLLIELIQAAIGLVTLTMWRPILTMTFAQWHNRRDIRRRWLMSNKEYESVYGR